MPPLVLVLDEARVGPADDDGDELVRPVVADEVGDVELGGRAGVLRDADRLAVDEDVERALGAAETEHDAAPPPAAGHENAPPVDARSGSASGTFGGGSGNGITTFV